MKKRDTIPPKIATKFLRMFLRQDLQADVTGDLEENFEYDLMHGSPLRAKVNYWKQVFLYLRPFAIRRMKRNTRTYFMLTNYFKIAARGINRNRFYTSLNIVCLSIGFTASILAAMFIIDEHSYDEFHDRADRLFRLNKVNLEANGSTSLTAETSGLMGPTMVSEYPEVESCVRFLPWFNPSGV